MSIGESIKKLRIEQSMTQEELAKHVHIAQSMVAQIERGTKIPSMLLGKEIAAALGCKVEELYS